MWWSNSLYENSLALIAQHQNTWSSFLSDERIERRLNLNTTCFLLGDSILFQPDRTPPHYTAMIKNYLDDIFHTERKLYLQIIPNLKFTKNHIMSHKDGKPNHYTRMIRNYLHDEFSYRWIDKQEAIERWETAISSDYFTLYFQNLYNVKDVAEIMIQELDITSPGTTKCFNYNSSGLILSRK